MGVACRRVHAFDAACERLGFEHRLTESAHPWTNGPAERMNHTVEDAPARRCAYDTHDELRAHLRLFLDACSYAPRHTTRRGRTPYEFVCKARAEHPERFTRDPTRDALGRSI